MAPSTGSIFDLGGKFFAISGIEPGSFDLHLPVSTRRCKGPDRRRGRGSEVSQASGAGGQTASSTPQAVSAAPKVLGRS